MTTTTERIQILKAAAQDFEWYPTTQQIIDRVAQDIRNTDGYMKKSESILDIGAGDGRILTAMKKAGLQKLFAIEKALPHLQRMPAEIAILGTDFWSQSLVSKQVDVIFCNPPYSEFEAWAAKIIREAAAQKVYMVIPDRWQDSSEIKDAIEERKASFRVLGSYDFLAADRKARARVELVRFEVKNSSFECEFSRSFSEFVKGYDAWKTGEYKAKHSEKAQGLVRGGDFAAFLVAAYAQEMSNIQANYEKISTLDFNLLHTLGVTLPSLQESLRNRLAGLNKEYWNELFRRLDKLTQRLTAKSRRDLLRALNEHANIDFTMENISAVVLWAMKNVNAHIEKQFLETYEQLIESANVRAYKSNQRTFEGNMWQYLEKGITHFALDYRIVSHMVGGFATRWSSSSPIRLEDRAVDFIEDLKAIAENLGFPRAKEDLRADALQWEPGQKQNFSWHNPATGKDEVLFEVKCFLNKNIHIKFNTRLILAMNVEFGRLQGWIFSGEQASKELGDKDAKSFYNATKSLPLLDFDETLTKPPEPLRLCEKVE